MRDRPSRSRRPGGRSRPAAPAAPSVARPAARRSGAGGTGITRTAAPRARGHVPARAVVLGVVLLALALSYVFPLRVYLAQQAEIAQLRESNAERQERVAELTEQAALWEDADYIRIQARKRLHFGEPDETLIITSWEGDGQSPGPGRDRGDAPASPTPWWDRLWASVQEANGTPHTADAAGEPG